MLPLKAARMGVAGREALALARQATLLPRDVRAVLPPVIADGDHVVVLVHGVFASAGVLRPLREHIEQASTAKTASFSYPPWFGVRELATRLGALVARLPPHVHLHLVGHSLGGLVAREYAQRVPRDTRVVQTISLASPFAGTRQARWLPVAFGRDIAHGSALLRALHHDAAAASDVPHTSFVATSDTVLDPPSSAAFLHGEVIEIADVGHNTLLYDEGVQARVARLVADRVLASTRATW